MEQILRLLRAKAIGWLSSAALGAETSNSPDPERRGGVQVPGVRPASRFITPWQPGSCAVGRCPGTAGEIPEDNIVRAQPQIPATGDFGNRQAKGFTTRTRPYLCPWLKSSE